jgi:predicted dehydrogenase
MQKQESRRSFLEKIGIGIGGTTIVSALPTFANSVSEKIEIFEGKKLRIALVGLGRYAGYLADSFVDAKYCELTGLVTGTPEKEETWGKKYNVPKQNIYNYKNFDKIADNKEIDLIYIVLPNAMHKEFAIRAAKAKKHIIVEKPMAITAVDCLEMIKAAKENKVQLAMGYRLHYEPYHMEMMRLGQQKILGPVRLIEVSLGYKSGDPTQWRHIKALSGGGPLMNLGVYCVQAGRYIMGEEPIAVTAQFGPVTNKELFKEIEESITWQMEFPSGAVCTSTSTYNGTIDRLFAMADDGFMELTPAVSYGPFQGKTNKGELKFADINQQAAQMDGISKVILDGNQLPEHIAGIEGWKDMKVLEAIYKSANAGGKKVRIV